MNKKVVPKLSFWKKHKKFILITGINLLLLAGLIIGLFFGLKKKKNGGGDKPIPTPPPGSTPSCSGNGTWNGKTCICKPCFMGPSCENSTQKYYCGLDNNDKRMCRPCKKCNDCPLPNSPERRGPSSQGFGYQPVSCSADRWDCKIYDSEDSCRDDGCKKVSNLSPCVDSSFCKEGKCCYDGEKGTPPMPCAPDDDLPGKGVCKSSCENKSTSYPDGKICPYYPCSKISDDLLANCKENLGKPGTVDCCSFLKNQINPANCAICTPGDCDNYNPTQGNKGASGSPGGGKNSCISQYTYDNNFKGCSSTSVCGRVPGACTPSPGTSSCDYEIGNPPSGNNCYSTTVYGLFSPAAGGIYWSCDPNKPGNPPCPKNWGECDDIAVGCPHCHRD